MIKHGRLGTRMRLSRVAAVIALPLLIATVAAALGAGTVEAGADDRAIRSVADAAVHAQQEVGLPPLRYTGGRMSTRLQTEMISVGRRQLQRHFAKRQLLVAIRALEDNVGRQSSGDVRTLAAGVSSIDITSVSVRGDRGSATATVDLWLDIAQVQIDGTMAVAHPRNTMLFDLSLEKISGDWFVVDETGTFAQGTAP